jgi:hypothetical protein
MTSRRRRYEAHKLHEAIESRMPLVEGDNPALMIPLALRPPTPLDEARRQKMKARMLAAFDGADVSRANSTHTLGKPSAQVAVAEVRTSAGIVRIADLDTIDAERAHAVAAAALRLVADTDEGDLP